MSLEILLGSSTTLAGSTGFVTVIVVVAVLPFSVVAVIVATPSFFAIILPFLSTETTFGESEVHVIDALLESR
jgi:hypothetical protein